MKFILALLLCLILLPSCQNNSLNKVSINKSNNLSIDYDYYSNLEIQIENMYNLCHEIYAIYFYSEYCYSCSSLKKELFNYLNLNNKIIPDFYLLNIDKANEEEFNKMPWANRMSDEQILINTLNATSIEDTFFKSAPSIYIIEKINDTNTLTNLLLSYDSIYNFLSSNQI